MSDLISVKIDVTKIEKDRLFSGKNGAKYLDVILIPTPGNKYGDSHMVVQGVSKEERIAGKKGPILGNAKTIEGQSRQREQGSQVAAEAQSGGQTTDDVPF